MELLYRVGNIVLDRVIENIDNQIKFRLRKTEGCHNIGKKRDGNERT